jgi:thiol-disulfide isomerase/thioredoxin
METINEAVAYFQNLPKIKKIILVIMAVIIIIFLVDIFRTYTSKSKQNYNDVPKKISKMEKMDSKIVNNNTDDSNMLTVGDLTIDTTKTNVTLYFADWCGHCKQFIKTTWEKFSEHYGTVDKIKLNKVDCTNTKTEIKTPAGKTVQGFPTVILNYMNSDGEYIEEEYSGGRSYEVFSKYVEQLGGAASSN